ncbi:hypothetical protein PMIN03_012872 [Paraphaeosphaeria minitans]
MTRLRTFQCSRMQTRMLPRTVRDCPCLPTNSRSLPIRHSVRSRWRSNSFDTTTPFLQPAGAIGREDQRLANRKAPTRPSKGSRPPVMTMQCSRSVQGHYRDTALPVAFQLLFP